MRRSAFEMIEKVACARSRAAITELVERFGPQDRLHPELSRLSGKKLDELWTNRPAQLQVLSNILHARGVKVKRQELDAIKSHMVNKPLRHIADAVAAVLTMEEQTA